MRKDLAHTFQGPEYDRVFLRDGRLIAQRPAQHSANTAYDFVPRAHVHVGGSGDTIIEREYWGSRALQRALPRSRVALRSVQPEDVLPGERLREPEGDRDRSIHENTGRLVESVLANLRRLSTRVAIPSPGPHLLTVWMVDPGVVIDKLVLGFAPPTDSYLGPPELYRR